MGRLPRNGSLFPRSQFIIEPAEANILIQDKLPENLDNPTQQKFYKPTRQQHYKRFTGTRL